MRYFSFIIILCVACGEATKDKQPSSDDSLKQLKERIELADDGKQVLYTEYKDVKQDTLYTILSIAADRDSLEYFNTYNHFIYLKSGYLLSSKSKHAVLVYEVKKDNYTYEFYAFENDKWVLKNKNLLGYLFPVNFGLYTEDYNFDGLKDIYIQATCSNGVAISKGHLLIQSKDGRLINHTECGQLGNMKPDSTQNTIISDEWISCAPNDQYPSGSVCKLTNKWKNGKLVTIKRNCPCKPDKTNLSQMPLYNAVFTPAVFVYIV